MQISTRLNATVNVATRIDEMKRENRFAERLKELRRARGLTQRDMARQLWLIDVGCGGWERGDTEPSNGM